ncbi:MAG: hypothetical protein JJ916_12320 [Phycisphaerales bacterium]|nr:hypothetical protein [Phycisphaerales bacterium]
MRPTTFVFGAGTSHPFGFPTGLGLIEQLVTRHRNELKDDEYSYFDHAIRHYSYPCQYQQRDQFFELLERSGIDSIDRYIQQQDETLTKLGKAALAYQLMALESRYINNSTLLFKCEYDAYSYQSDSSRIYHKNAYRHLWNVFTRANPLEEIKKHKFVTFNYDRAFEHFMFYAYKGYTNSTTERAEKFVRDLPIHHVYGSLGEYNHSKIRNQIDWYLVNKHCGHEEVAEAADNINTVRVTGNQPEVSKEFVSAFIGTDQIMILGFGYDPVNTAMLRIAYDRTRTQKQNDPHKYWFGSAMGKTKQEKQRIMGMTGMDLHKLGHQAHDDVTFMRSVGFAFD